ncbi:toll/interleukin-1 receptor domain-containing protein [Klebsiella pneumoniae]|nr:toll/interleukin-1 receptor domain-containing protein [Klebsiella pneumoniae]
MSDAKPVIFISHIAEEAEIAVNLKALIEKSFLNFINVFVSSDAHSSSIGDGWLSQIQANLSESIYTIVICSPKSIGRPWINFEAGASWIKNIKIAPLCHSGLSPEKLPIPLTNFNGTCLDNNNGLENLFFSIAKEVKLLQPNVDFSGFIRFISEFQEKYLIDDKLIEIFNKFEQFTPSFLKTLLDNKESILFAPLSEETYVTSSLTFLENNNVVKSKLLSSNVNITNIGQSGSTKIPTQIKYKITPHDNFIDLLRRCKLIRLKE